MEKNYPNLVQSSILIICQIILYTAILYIFAAIGAFKTNNFSLLTNNTTQQLSYILSSIAVIVYGLNKSGHRLFRFFKTDYKYIQLFYIIPIFLIGFCITLSELHNILSLFIKIPDYNSESAIYSNNITGFILGCIFAPVAEEIIYRGIVLNGYSKNYSSTVTITLSSLLYGLSQVTPGKILTAFVFGTFLAWLYVKTASLVYPTLAHISINTINFVTQFSFIPHIRGFSPSKDNFGSHIQHQSIWFTLTGVVLLILTTLQIRKIFRNNGTSPD